MMTFRNDVMSDDVKRDNVTSLNHPCKDKPSLYGNSREFPENAIFQKGIPREFPSIPDLGNSSFGNSPPLPDT